MGARRGPPPGQRRAAPWPLALSALLLGCGAPAGSIGAMLVQEETGALRVREAPEGLTGARAGLAPGDEVVAIDGADVRGLDRDEVHRRLQGPIGTRVELTVVRGGVVEKVSVMRGPYRKKR